ncbi:uncharacterized protein E6C27_scaffold82G002200 [Cucumis melo var. makuwa]|uniref:Uncharacterized protein n=1 Tax=Cucumis melo var. makuwa TaxID=1194695 RepID=A0A5A7V9R4_CUCMM|nr:uncharacterized protein E6C27_scaffold82G002200 [Cucumis melo var. makuwa]
MTASSLSYSSVSSSLKPPPPLSLPLFPPDGVSGNAVPGFFPLSDSMPLLTRIRTLPPPDAAPPPLSLGVAIHPPLLPPMDSKSPVIHPNSPSPPDPRALDLHHGGFLSPVFAEFLRRQTNISLLVADSVTPQDELLVFCQRLESNLSPELKVSERNGAGKHGIVVGIRIIRSIFSSSENGVRDRMRLVFAKSSNKGCGINEFSSSTAMAKRLKRRKALADLRVEESLLLKERVHLKKELESLHATFKEQTTNNEKLKKMKLNMNFNTSLDHLRDMSKPVASNQQCQRADPTTESVPATLPIQTVPGNSSQSESNNRREINSMESGGFFLPDLNMIPAEDCL